MNVGLTDSLLLLRYRLLTQTRQREADISENKSLNVPMNTHLYSESYHELPQYSDLIVDSCINQGTGVLKACQFLQCNRYPLPTVMGLNLKQFTYMRADTVYIFASFVTVVIYLYGCNSNLCRST